ncbi:MAG TPA: hypothetical protein VGA99_00440 [bacterium]
MNENGKLNVLQLLADRFESERWDADYYGFHTTCGNCLTDAFRVRVTQSGEYLERFTCANNFCEKSTSDKYRPA